MGGSVAFVSKGEACGKGGVLARSKEALEKGVVVRAFNVYWGGGGGSFLAEGLFMTCGWGRPMGLEKREKGSGGGGGLWSKEKGYL